MFGNNSKLQFSFAAVPAGVVFALADPSGWCAGGCADRCGGRFSAFAAASLPHSRRPPPASLRFCRHVVRRAAVSSQGPRPHERRSRSSAVMHVTPELEVLGSNPGGVGPQCLRRWGVCDPASWKGCCEGQVGITVTLFGVRSTPEHFTFTLDPTMNVPATKAPNPWAACSESGAGRPGG